MLSAHLGGILVDLKRYLFSNGPPCVAAVTVLAANLIISIERMQSGGGEKGGAWGGGGGQWEVPAGVGGQKSGLSVLEPQRLSFLPWGEGGPERPPATNNNINKRATGGLCLLTLMLG